MNAKELRRLMPQNAKDESAARALVALGSDIIEPVVPDMLRRLKDHNSPVADIYCEFFATHGERFVNVIHDFLFQSNLPETKNVIVTKILVHWSRDAISKLAPNLQMLMTHTDFFNTDIIIISILQKHHLAEEKWLLEWLDFKQCRLNKLLNEANKVRGLFEI